MFFQRLGWSRTNGALLLLAAAADFFTTASYCYHASLPHQHTKGAHANNTLVFNFFNELKYIIIR